MNLQEIANRVVSTPLLAVDTETWDPDLLTKGPGFARGNAIVVGVALAWPEGDRVETKYLAIGHEGGGNMNCSQVLEMLYQSLSKRKLPVVMANCSYDLEALHRHKVYIKCPVYDIQIAEALLNENRRSYKLDTLANDYLGERKLTETLTQTVVDKLGVKKEKAMANIWRLPAEYVDEYARADTDLTLRIWLKQEPEIVRQDLCRVWKLECDLVHVLHAMRWQGVRIDVDGAERFVTNMTHVLKTHHLASLKRLTGSEIQIWAHAAISNAANSLGLVPPPDENGKESFNSPWMLKQTHPFFINLVAARRIDKAITYVQSLLDYQINGRVHCQYHQTRGDRGGARSGRLSASHPNLQQVPGRHEDLAKPIRQLFVPDDGEVWASNDYSQAEPRITVHYAHAMGLQGATAARQKYIDEPATDYHQMVADMCGIDRFPAKTLNLGLAYGMGKKKMADALGLPIEEAEPLFRQYHAGVPFVKLLSERCISIASQRGYVKTILGRRRRFNLWGPQRWTKDAGAPLKFDEAKEKWGNVNRYFVHKAMNAVVQGTAADILKTAMVALHREGILPLMSIHDDLPMSLDPGASGTAYLSEQLRQVKYIMETCLPLSVPHLVEPVTGPTWGDCK